MVKNRFLVSQNRIGLALSFGKNPKHLDVGAADDPKRNRHHGIGHQAGCSAGKLKNREN